MQIFLSYASEDREFADAIQLALVGSGHHVFFDKASLPVGGDYHSRIKSAVQSTDVFIFLISPNSVAKGSYTLTELTYARAKWAHPKEKLVPVLVRATDWNEIPSYLTSVTVLELEGNIVAEVLAAVSSLNTCRAPSNDSLILPPLHDRAPDYKDRKARPELAHTIQIWLGIISLAGALGAAVISNWQNIFPAKPVPTRDSTGNSTQAKYTLRMYDVDDIAELYINEKLEYKAQYGYQGRYPTWFPFEGYTNVINSKPGDSQEIDITDRLNPGDNTLRFTLLDSGISPGGASLSISVKKNNEEVIYEPPFQTPDITPGQSSLVYDKTFHIIKR